jgi:thiol-disulfide isomerase/thioredoxin
MHTKGYLPFRWCTPAIILFSLAGWLSQAQPANDMFANRIVITGTNTVLSGSNIDATKEPEEPDHAGDSGGASVWYTWTAPFSGFVTISTAGSDFDTMLGVYTGSSVASLTWVADNDDEDYDAGIYTSRVFAEVTARQTYQIAVDGYGGDSGSVRLQLQLQPFPVAPAWIMYDPAGHINRSSDFTNLVVILDFWATWCVPCKAEMPDLVALQNKYRADGLAVVGADVSWSGDSSQDVQSFMVTNTPALNYQVVMSTSAIESAYGSIDAIPTTFIIDRQNIIRKKYVGTQPGSTLEQAIIPLLYANTQLTCQRSANQLLFYWPTNTQTFRLESAPTPSGTWSTWPTGPTVVNGTNTVLVPATNSAHYFRLHMTY